VKLGKTSPVSQFLTGGFQLGSNRAMHRRSVLTALGAAALAPGVASAAGPHRVALSDAFLLLDSYLGLPPAERNAFYLAYLARRDGKPAPDAQAAIIAADGTRTPLVLGPDGLVTNLPTLDQLKSKAMFETAGPPFKFGLEMRATMAPATQVTIAALFQVLVQVNAAIDKFSEGAAVGKLTVAYFPDAGAGRTLFPDGHTIPLSVSTFPGLGPIPYVEPRKVMAAQAVTLDAAPSRILLGGPPPPGRG
jgi:hypothetical protein